MHKYRTEESTGSPTQSKRHRDISSKLQGFDCPSLWSLQLVATNKSVFCVVHYRKYSVVKIKKKNNLKPLQCVRDDFHLKTSEIQYVTKENVLWKEKNHSNITLHLGKKPTLTNILAEEQRTYWCKQNTLGLLPLQQLFPINYIKQNPFLSREDRLQCHLESAAHTVLLFGH